VKTYLGKPHFTIFAKSSFVKNSLRQITDFKIYGSCTGLHLLEQSTSKCCSSTTILLRYIYPTCFPHSSSIQLFFLPTFRLSTVPHFPVWSTWNSCSYLLVWKTWKVMLSMDWRTLTNSSWLIWYQSVIYQGKYSSKKKYISGLVWIKALYLQRIEEVENIDNWELRSGHNQKICSAW